MIRPRGFLAIGRRIAISAPMTSEDAAIAPHAPASRAITRKGASNGAAAVRSRGGSAGGNGLRLADARLGREERRLVGPLPRQVESFGTGRIPDEDIEALIDRHFDLRPASIISALDLRRPIYRQTAAYGHFGRPDLDLPWERTDKAALLASEAGIRQPEPVSAA